MDYKAVLPGALCLRGDKGSVFIRLYIHITFPKEVISSTRQVDSAFYLWPDMTFLWSFANKEMSLVVHDTEGPYREQVSLDNTKLKLKPIRS